MSAILNRKRAFSSLKVAEGLYGSAFNAASREDVGNAMHDWSELSEAERGFALCQLLYLNLKAQTYTGRLLRRAVHELETLNDGVQELADDYFSDDDDPAADEEAADEEAADEEAADEEAAEDPAEDELADDEHAADEDATDEGATNDTAAAHENAAETGHYEGSLAASGVEAQSLDLEASEQGVTGRALSTAAAEGSPESMSGRAMEAAAVAVSTPHSASVVTLTPHLLSAGRNV